MVVVVFVCDSCVGEVFEESVCGYARGSSRSMTSGSLFKWGDKYSASIDRVCLSWGLGRRVKEKLGRWVWRIESYRPVGTSWCIFRPYRLTALFDLLGIPVCLISAPWTRMVMSESYSVGDMVGQVEEPRRAKGSSQFDISRITTERISIWRRNPIFYIGHAGGFLVMFMPNLLKLYAQPILPSGGGAVCSGQENEVKSNVRCLQDEPTCIFQRNQGC